MSTEHEVYDRLIIRRDCYWVQDTKPDDKGSFGYKHRKTPLTRKEIDQSILSNALTFGTATTENGTNLCKCPIIDIDNHDGTKKIIPIIETLYNSALKAGFKPIIEASSGDNVNDGCHILFPCQPTLSAHVRTALSNIVNASGLEDADIEVFPKQDIVEQDKYGNFCKLPFQYHNKTGKRSCIINPETMKAFERPDAINYIMACQNNVFPEIHEIETPIQPIKDAPTTTTEPIKSDMNFDDVFGLKNIKPCIIKAYDEKLILHGKGDQGHNFRLAIAGDLIFNGADDDVISEYFRIQPDFSKKETEKGIESIRKYLKGGNNKPMGCRVIKKKCSDIIGEMCETCKRNPLLSSKEHKEIKAPLELPPIPQETIDPTPITIQDALNVFEEHLYVEEHFNITIPLSEVIANFSPIEPDIIGIIGASGSAKTEMIRALGEMENQFCYPVSSITSHTLVTGLPENIDLAPMLRGRILTIKDLTTILSKNKDMVSEIFADFRELTDGHIGKDFGSGVKKHYTGIHSSVLFGCTNAIEAHNSIFSVLGQRILFFRPRNDRRKSMEKAISNNGKETAIRIALHKITLQLINTMLTKHGVRLENLTQNLSNEYIQDIGDLACFLAIVRTHISRDYRGDMAALPEPEYPTRLAKTLCKLVDAHSLLYDREPIDEDMKVAYRLSNDNIPTERLKVLTVLLDGEPRSTTEVQTEPEIPTFVGYVPAKRSYEARFMAFHCSLYIGYNIIFKIFTSFLLYALFNYFKFCNP